MYLMPVADLRQQNKNAILRLRHDSRSSTTSTYPLCKYDGLKDVLSSKTTENSTSGWMLISILLVGANIAHRTNYLSSENAH